MVFYRCVVQAVSGLISSIKPQIWDLFETQYLFSAQGPDGEQSSVYHLAEIHAILGPPPMEYLQRSKTSREHFTDGDSWKAAVPIPDVSFETMERRLHGDNKSQLLDFIRRMLQWRPEERHTAKQLLDDPWLN